MGPISISRAVDAPRPSLFDLIVDLSYRPAYTDHFLDDFRLERLPPRGEGAGARFRLARGGFWSETVIERTERPHLIVERGRGGRLDRVKVSTVWELVEGPGAVTTVTLTFRTEPPIPLDRLRELGRGRWIRRQWGLALRRLGDLAESGAEPPRRVDVAGTRREPTGVP
jgi:uncharacterized protein YndB with AHSA1/START domain